MSNKVCFKSPELIFRVLPIQAIVTKFFFFLYRHDKYTLAHVKEGYRKEDGVTFSLNRGDCLSLSICVCLCPESTDEEVDKLHCLNHSGSSATYSDYSPSQGSSGSSNPPANTHSHTHSHAHPHAPALPPPSKDQAPQTHWTNRYTQTHTHACFMFNFIATPPSRTSIISSSLSIQTPPSISSIYHSSIHPIAPSILSSLHLSVSFCISLLTQSRSERLIRMLQTSAQDSLYFPLSLLSSLLCSNAVQSRLQCYLEDLFIFYVKIANKEALSLYYSCYPDCRALMVKFD